MYAKRYTNKKGQEKVEVLLSVEEARDTVNDSPAKLLEAIRAAIEENAGGGAYKSRGTPGGYEGLKMLFEEQGERKDNEPS